LISELPNSNGLLPKPLLHGVHPEFELSLRQRLSRFIEIIDIFGSIALCIRVMNRRLEVEMREHHISGNTYRLNKALLMSLIAQMAIPFCCIGVSASVAGAVVWFELPVTRGMS